MEWMAGILLQLLFILIQALRSFSIDSGISYVSNRDRTPPGSCYQDLKEMTADCSNRHMTSVPNNLPVDLRSLDLSHNSIQTLCNTSFNHYPLLITLDLSNNDIYHIEIGAFYPLKLLIELDLSYNDDLQLPSGDIFRNLGNLSNLYVAGANLKSFPDATMNWLPQLKTLVLDGNIIERINFSSCGAEEKRFIDLSLNEIRNITPETFVCDCKCQIFSLLGNEIQNISAETIATLNVKKIILGASPLLLKVWDNLFNGISHSNIEELMVTMAELQDIPLGFFDALRDHSLSLLDLTQNKLHSLRPLTFTNLTKLKHLRLSLNEIVTIEPEYFTGMEELKTLDMNSNQIISLNPNNSTWTLDIEKLFLSANKLSEVNENALLGLENLTDLDLSNNPDLSVLHITSFSRLRKLRALDVSYTSLHRLFIYCPLLKSISFEGAVLWEGCLVPGETFSHALSLEDVNIANALVSTQNIWNAVTDVSLFDDLRNLSALYLNHNHILQLPAGVFQHLSSLVELDISESRISHLHSESFKGLTSLRTLRLCGNKIQSMPTQLLKDLQRLVNFHADDNFLWYLDRGIFVDTITLRNLTLANNQLTKFNRSTFDPVNSTLKSIDLSGNPIACDCEMHWLVEWLRGSVEVLKANQTFCSSASATLAPLRNKSLMTFDADNLCGPNITLIYSVPLAIVGVILVFVIAHQCYRNRWFLRYKLFMLKVAFVGYKEIRDVREQESFEFDLNIMYVDDDEGWVTEHLKPAILTRFPDRERITFGDDNLPLGMHYVEAVHYVVQNSFKTVLLLSRAALFDNWFVIKFRTAFDHVSDEQTENMVVVLLEDIPDDELPHIVRLYLAGHRPYFRWLDSVRGRELFWYEFMMSLTVNLRSNHLVPIES